MTLTSGEFPTMTQPRYVRRVVGAGATILLALAATGPSAAADLQQILARFDEVQGSIQTISARFTETTTNQMLKEPMVAAGRFYMTKPDSICWEYDQPEEMRFVIASDEYTGYFPARNRAEKRGVRRWSEKIFRLIGLGQASTELSKFYDIKLADDQTQEAGGYLLLLEPRKKRVRKRVEAVRFWLDGDSFLPTRVEYRGQNGNTRLLEFHEISLNPDLSASVYVMDLPAGVTIVKGFSGLPGLGPQDYELTDN